MARSLARGASARARGWTVRARGVHDVARAVIEASVRETSMTLLDDIAAASSAGTVARAKPSQRARPDVGLPSEHEALLRAWGPVITADGLARFRDVVSVDGFAGIAEWNEVGLWKHAWPGID